MSNSNGKNRNTAVILFAVVGGMVGLAFASVPLYRLFCQVTGFGGTTVVASSKPTNVVDANAPIMTVRFDSNVDKTLPWYFKPDQKEVKIRVGSEGLATFTATNTGDTTIIGNATFNVTPYKAGEYFVKVECFCFTEQKLAPHQTVSMPVSFFIDPDILNDPNAIDVKEITLSYTFYRAPADKDLQALTEKTAINKAGLDAPVTVRPLTKSETKT